MNKKKIKVILGMSGGVDSSVSAFLLKEAGYDVTAIFMRNWDSIANNDILGNNNSENSSICPEEYDWEDAKKVAEQLDIPIFREDFIDEYWNYVFSNLISEYKNGRTPNPDILCNKYIKFGLFYDRAISKYNADFIATGHYAKIKENNLCKATDLSKDQSYFLSQIDKKKLKNIMFPLSELMKTEVRKIAEKLNLINATKKDSTGICFIGERKFTQFLQNYIPKIPGDIIDIVTNKKIGKHDGVMYYTIGQRKGLNLGGMEEPYYVAGHNIKEKIIYAAPQSKPEYLISDKCTLKNFNILSHKYLNTPGLNAKFRYRQKDIPVELSIEGDNIYIIYKEGVKGITPGQQCVLYFQDICVGGGIIDLIFKNNKTITYLC